MRMRIAQFLSVVMLLTAAAPALAPAQMAGAHSLGCDMTAMLDTGHDGTDTPEQVRGESDALRVCPLSASCPSAMIDDQRPPHSRVAVSAVRVVTLIMDREISASLELDPPPPRRG
ncbi:hypothetical protein [Pyruvatibacter sp.]|uniref:hypothetical protein n=1 Tax=Pyruvatibacter sp. TaxID=1981328 RepID=UPI0032EC4356